MMMSCDALLPPSCVSNAVLLHVSADAEQVALMGEEELRERVAALTSANREAQRKIDLLQVINCSP